VPPKGTKASAALYSLIETAKANRLEPYAYLQHIFNDFLKDLTGMACGLQLCLHGTYSTQSLGRDFNPLD